MSYKSSSLTLALFTILLCADASAKVRRYKSAQYAGRNDHLVRIDVFDTRLEESDDHDSPPPSKDLWRLSGRGQQEIIKAIDKRSKDNNTLISSLKNLGDNEKNENEPLSFTQQDLQMVFSISKARTFNSINSSESFFSPADRIEYLKITMTLPDDASLKFTKWNKYATEYGNVDVADVSFSRTYELGASVGAENSHTSDKKNGSDENNVLDVVKGITVSPSIDGKASFGSTENQKVKYRFIQLNGRLSDKKLTLEEEGMREIDLCGNILVNVSLAFDPKPEKVFKVENVKNDNGNYNPSNKLHLLSMTAQVPNCLNLPATINATLQLDYVYRHVTNRKGQRTFYEWDDKVKYYEGTCVKSVPIFKNVACTPDFYCIGLNGEDDKCKVFIKNKTGSYDLVFTSQERADEFINWMTHFPCKNEKEVIKIGEYQLLIEQGGKRTGLTKEVADKNIATFHALREYRQ